jgi:uncharacterized phiE125 gp8 family phage protein
MAYVLVTPPSVEPVSQAEAKRHCRIDTSDDDTQIAAFIVAARQHFERQTNRSLITQEWQLVLDAFPACGAPIRVGRGPIQSIDALSYIDTAGATQVVDLVAEDYIIDLSGDVARVLPPVADPWPVTYRRPGAVSVEFTAGHGDAATDVPQLARQGQLLIIGHWWANRETVVVAPGSASVLPVPFAAQAIIDSYWNPELG